MFRCRATAALAAAGVLSVVASWQPALAGAKHAAMAIDANTGEVLHDEDGDEPRHPASLTKMMTLYLTFEAIESGRLKPASRVPISETAASAQPSKLDLDPGDTIAVSDAIRALITKSANDVAIALAEAIGGSERGFVKLMNQRARDLGMKATNFENASGLPDARQVSTARDMITLGLRLQDDYPTYYPMFASRTFAYGGKTLRNHNTLLNSFQGADGIKTGYTRMSGFNLVSSVRRNGRHVVAAVFGGKSAATRNGEMRVMLNRALASASTEKTRKRAPLLIAKLKSPPKAIERPSARKAPAARQAEAAEVAAAARRPELKRAPKPEPQPFAAPATAEAPVEIAAQTPSASAPVEVYKVKRVSVTPRSRASAPVDPDATTDMTMEDLIAAATGVSDAGAAEPAAEGARTPTFVTAGAAATPARAAFTTASVEVEPNETLVAKLRRATADNDATMSMLGARDIAPPASATDAAADEPAMLRGLAPSTLAAQAAALKSAETAPVATAAVKQAAKVAGRYEVQIGAYESADEARRKLADVKSRAGATLDGARAVTQPTKKADRTMYRARFAGFSADDAASACSELRSRSIDCFVMTSE